MTTNPPDPIASVEREWAAVRKVEAKHSAFHLHPSPEAATALTDAVREWEATTAEDDK